MPLFGHVTEALSATRDVDCYRRAIDCTTAVRDPRAGIATITDFQELRVELLRESMVPRERSSAWQLSLLVSLFILWGACNALNDVLIRQFKLAFTLSDMRASLVQTAFYFGYLLGGLPAAFLARKCGYKATVCFGLALVCIGAGLFWPSARAARPSYEALLLCLYLLAFGLAFLESSANPWIVLLGERRREGFGTAALNLAQAFNPLGSVGGVLLGRQLILGSETVEAVGTAYLALGALFLLVMIAFCCTRFPAGDGRSQAHRQRLQLSTIIGCLRRRAFACGVCAQFLNIGGQTCVWSFAIRYTRVALPDLPDRQAADALLLSLVLFLVGRFASTALLRCVRAPVLLATQCTLAAALCVVAAASSGFLGVAAVSFKEMRDVKSKRLNADCESVSPASLALSLCVILARITHCASRAIVCTALRGLSSLRHGLPHDLLPLAECARCGTCGGRRLTSGDGYHRRGVDHAAHGVGERWHWLRRSGLPCTRGVLCNHGSLRSRARAWIALRGRHRRRRYRNKRQQPKTSPWRRRRRQGGLEGGGQREQRRLDAE